jgi:hypothetical protein
MGTEVLAHTTRLPLRVRVRHHATPAPAATGTDGEDHTSREVRGKATADAGLAFGAPPRALTLTLLQFRDGRCHHTRLGYAEDLDGY